MHRCRKVNKKAVSMNLLWPLLPCCSTMTNIMISCPLTSICVRQTMRIYNSIDEEGKGGQFLDTCLDSAQFQDSLLE